MKTYGIDDAKVIIRNFSKNWIEFKSDGVHLTSEMLEYDTSQVLHWKYVCELENPDAPNPLTAPALPFPFTANELTAYMLDGVGAVITSRYGNWEDGPDQAMLDSMGELAREPKRAITDAYGAFMAAQEAVGSYPAELQKRADRLCKIYRYRNLKANEREGVFADGVTRDEANARRARAIASNAELERLYSLAMKEYQAAFCAWRKAMVKELLKPAPALKSASIAPVVAGADESEPVSPEFDKWRLRWRAVSFDETRVKKDLYLLEMSPPNDSSRRNENRTSLLAELTQITGRKDWLVLQMGVDMHESAERRFTIEEIAESRQPLDVDGVIKRVKDIALANQEIDALIASHKGPATEADQTEAVALVPPNPLQQVEQVPADAITLVVTNAIQSEANGDAEPAMPSWKVKTGPTRDRGYRLDLLSFLKAEMLAGKPIPSANDLINAWEGKPPVDTVVIRNGALVNPPKSEAQDKTQENLVRQNRNGIRYKISTGEFRYATLKSINARIKSLTELSQ